MRKKYFAGGFFYNTRTKKVLLHVPEDITTQEIFALIGGPSKPGETPAETFKRHVYEHLRAKLPVTTIEPLYDYYNDDMPRPRFIFYVETKHLKKTPEIPDAKTWKWVPMEGVFKLPLTERTKQDLTFFHRETQAKSGVNIHIDPSLA